MICNTIHRRELGDTLFHLGLSISYDRVLDISMDMANVAASLYESDGVVCPLILRNGLFTTGAVDNIDHNPSSNTARDSFHGTGISLFQNRENQVSNEEELSYNKGLQTRKFQNILNPTQT